MSARGRRGEREDMCNGKLKRTRTRREECEEGKTEVLWKAGKEKEEEEEEKREDEEEERKQIRI